MVSAVCVPQYLSGQLIHDKKFQETGMHLPMLGTLMRDFEELAG